MVIYIIKINKYEACENCMKEKFTRYILEKNTTEQVYSNRRLIKKNEDRLISRL